MEKTKLFFEFLSENEIKQFEMDLQERKYQSWVDKYPTYITSIFGALMYFAGYKVDSNDVAYFKSKGVNLNTASNAYPSDSYGITALGSACEFRNTDLIKALVSHGALIDQEDPHGFTPLESLLTGHSPEDMKDFEKCEKGVKVLLELGATKSVQKFVNDTFCKIYKEKSPFMAKLLTEAPVRTPTVKPQAPPPEFLAALKEAQSMNSKQSLSNTMPVPVKQPTIPVKQPTVPAKQVTVPAKQVTIPVKQPTVPAKQVTVPIKQPTVPIKQVTVPIKQPTVPVKPAGAPVKSISKTPVVTTKPN